MSSSVFLVVRVTLLINLHSSISSSHITSHSDALYAITSCHITSFTSTHARRTPLTSISWLPCNLFSLGNSFFYLIFIWDSFRHLQSSSLLKYIYLVFWNIEVANGHSNLSIRRLRIVARAFKLVLLSHQQLPSVNSTVPNLQKSTVEMME